jgi:hypothetical protein
MKLYHGSGKKFENFSNEYVNTGEEVQKYGYGIYLTNSIEIAKYYADRAAGVGYVYAVQIPNSLNVVDWNESIDTYTVSEMAKQLIGAEVFDAEIDEMGEHRTFFFQDDKFEEIIETILVDGANIEAWENLQEEVEDYDLSNFKSLINKSAFEFYLDDGISYETVYDFISSTLGGVTASKLMIKNGVDGFKFNATEVNGGINYTIFNSSNIKIINMQLENDVGLNESVIQLKGFIKSHLRDDNKSLVESIMKGYVSIFESVRDGLYYHVSNDKFTNFNDSDGGIWFTLNKASAINGEVGASGNSVLYTVKLNVHNLAGWDEYDNMDFYELKHAGFDGVKLDDDLVVFDDSQINIISVDEIKGYKDI